MGQRIVGRLTHRRGLVARRSGGEEVELQSTLCRGAGRVECVGFVIGHRHSVSPGGN